MVLQAEHACGKDVPRADPLHKQLLQHQFRNLVGRFHFGGFGVGLFGLMRHDLDLRVWLMLSEWVRLKQICVIRSSAFAR